MNTQQQAYITGFVKRANEYGYTDTQAIELLKQSVDLGGLINGAKQLGSAVSNAANQAVSNGGLIDTAKQVGGAVANAAHQATGISPEEHFRVLSQNREALEAAGKALETARLLAGELSAKNTELSGQLTHHQDQDPINMLIAGGVGLGGGALLHKFLGKKKHPEQR